MTAAAVRSRAGGEMRMVAARAIFPRSVSSSLVGLYLYPLLIVFLLLQLCASSVTGVSEDGLVLMQFKDRVDDTEQLLSPSWNASDASPCYWFGITCDPTGQRVTEIDLQNASLGGEVPGDIVCQLPKLTTLKLRYNYFSGPFPFGLLNCQELEVLDLSENYFVGSLPANISKLPRLILLSMAFNNFSGPIPAEFGQMPALTSLNISANLIEGPIPPELGNISTLQTILSTLNNFEGPIPSELGNLAQLTHLDLSWCKLTGPIPPSIGNTNLTTMYFTGNNLSGNIPPELGKLKHLQNLDVSQNMLTGGIPPEIGGLSELTMFYCWTNRLSGPLPSELGNLSSLQAFDVSWNFLNGSIPEGLGQIPGIELFQGSYNNFTGQIPSGFGNLSNLRIFKLFGNDLTGPLPPNLGNECVLQILDVSTNYLSGPIPPTLCNGGNLTWLILFENSFSGAIPTELSDCPSLRRVRMESNRLTGSVPKGLWGSPNLTALHLSNNSLTGNIGPEIAEATLLQALWVDYNQLSGPLPMEIGSILNLTEFSVSGNVLTGNIPSELGQLKWLEILDLGANSFDGSIPEDLSLCLRLDKLNLSRNRLAGPIPRELGNLPTLNTLDLSYNDLSGPVPYQLGNLQLTEYNFSYNNLSGALPSPFNLSVLPSSFVGNPLLFLCNDPDADNGDGTNCEVPYESGSTDPSSQSRHHKSLALAIGATFAAAAVILLLGGCCFWRKYRSQIRSWKNGGRDQDGAWSLRSFQKVGFMHEEVMDNLQDSCLIGSGGSGKVYKAELSDGQIVAVKKLEARDGNGFNAEVDTLGKIRHRNIVKLLCCCSNSESNVLVYEYMPNGSLGDYLHSPKGAPILSWSTRLKIALGAAEGLTYLHHDCAPPIVHRDVKSNNILLDEDFEAHLGDFGLAKTFQAQSMSVVAGSYGYIAPEYGYTLKVNEKSDIYSFGVVLLELVTGRRPVEPEFGDMDIVKWVTKNLETKSGSMEILDPLIKTAATQESMMLALRVGLLCTSALPVNRPSMRNVVLMLMEGLPRNQTILASDQLPPIKESVRTDPIFTDVEKL